MLKWTLPVAAACASIPAHWALAQQQVVPLRIVAQNGMHAPGLDVGTNFSNTIGTPVINADGSVAFWSGLSAGPSGSVWSEGGGRLSLVARTGQDAPGAAGAQFSLGIARPVRIDNDGNTAFNAALTGAVLPTDDSGIWAKGPLGGLRKVVRQGDPSPSSLDGQGYVFTTDFSEATLPLVFNGGRGAFGANADSPEPGTPAIAGVWSEGQTIGPRLLHVVARTGPGSSFTSVGPTVLNSFARTAFEASYTIPGEGVHGSIWSEGYGSFSQVVQTGSGAGGDVNFTSFGTPDMNDQGRVAFTAGSGGGNAIFKQFFEATTPVAATGSPAPGAGGSTFTGFFAPVINRSGHVAFLANVNGAGGALQGIWTDRHGQLDHLEPIAVEGGQVPGTALGTTWFFLASTQGTISMNSRDDVAFLAAVKLPDGTLTSGIWAEDEGVLHRIAMIGDTYEAEPGVFRTILGLALKGDSGNEDGRGSGFSDNGELTFLAANSAALGPRSIVVYGGHQWVRPTSDDWNITTNWTPDIVPNGVDDVANFLGSITAPSVINTPTPITVGTIRFDNDNTYTITGAGSLTLQRTTGAAAIGVARGAHQISLPLMLASNLNVNVTESASLTIDGPVTWPGGVVVNKNGPGTLNFNSSPASGAGALLKVNEGTANLNQSVGGSLSIEAWAAINLNAPQQLDVVTILGGGVVKLAPGSGPLKVNILSFAGVPDAWLGRLDLTNNSLIIQANDLTRQSVLETTVNQIASARNGPLSLWAGNGITSSTAAADPNELTGLAARLNDNGQGGVLYTSFNGVDVDANSILVKFTYMGDIDLNGVVDADDYFAIDSAFASGEVGNSGADLDGSGQVDADDYFIIDSSFGGQGAPLIGGVSVPEPSAAAVWVVSVIGLFGRRRRYGVFAAAATFLGRPAGSSSRPGL